MANDCLDLMRILGHDRFAVVGHDRGSYVALRLALDHPVAVSALAVLGTVPIGEALARCDARFARAWYHWFFFAQPETPERVINADPDSWYCVGDHATPERLGTANFVLRGAEDDLDDLYPDVPAVWRPWTTDLSTGVIAAGHHMAEDAPDEPAAALLSFLDDPSDGGA